MPSPLKVIVYHRVSSDDQADRGTIESQRHQTAAIVARHGLEVIEVVDDDGLSGTTLGPRRLKGVLRRIEAGDYGIDGIVTVSVDRLMRADRANPVSRADGNYLEGVLIDHKTKLYTNDGLQDLDSLSYAITTAVAGAERKKILERTSSGRYHHLVELKENIQKLPYGYKRVKEDKHATQEIKINDEEAARLVQIFTWICEHGLRPACRMASEARFPRKYLRYNKKTVTGDDVFKWHHKTVKEMAENLESYKSGVWRYTYRGHALAFQMPPMPIPDEVYLRLPKALKERTPSKPTVNLLTGLISCAHNPSHSIRSAVAQRLYKGKTSFYGYVSCVECHAERKLAEVEALVWAACRVQMLRVTEADRSNADIASLQQELDAVVAEQAALSEQSLRLTRAFTLGAVSEADFTAVGQEQVQRKRDLEVRQIKARKSLEAAKAAEVSEAEGLTRLLSKVKELWGLELTEASKEEVREAIKELIAGGRIQIDLGSKKEGRPIVVTVPAVGSVGALVYGHEERHIFQCRQELAVSVQPGDAVPWAALSFT